VITGIRAGEEAYKAETLGYVGCSGCGGAMCAPGLGSLTAYYPRPVPDDKKFNWDAPAHGDVNCWRLLNVVTDGPVRFGYAVVAGNPGQNLPAPSITPALTWPATATNNPWYVIQASGDRNNNGKFAILVSSSVTGEIFVQDEDE
jgi:type IV pilus assembly protein PilA